MTNEIASRNGRYVKANGLNIYYQEWGSGEPLILIHGGMGTGNDFERFIPVFSKQFRVITPDSRGHGKTDNPSGEFSYRLMADDLAAFMDALALNQPSICGWSDGGQIALELGMHYPDLTNCLVIGATWYKFSQTYTNALKALGIESSGVVNIPHLKQSLPSLVEIWSSLHSAVHGPDHWETVLTQISGMWSTPLNYTADDFQKIKTPTLIMVGDRDQLVPIEEAGEMYRLIQGAELAIVPNSDHSLPRIRREMFSQIVLDFLLRHDRQATTQ
jgi:pimeloyl-ACP methyl ester carboxylesterase